MIATPASALLAGLLPAAVQDPQPICLVTTDSREVCLGCVFVAFPGARFDGHSFAAQAIAQGAAYVVVNHPVEGVPADRMLVCPDSYRAMMIIGANYRKLFAPTVIGVTGSVGKTTTKEFTYAVFSAFGNAQKTEGNQNNELGVPRTLLRFDADTQYAVVEMGMSNLGEIDRLTRAACPDAAIITCIGVSHLESLGSRENILKAKLEICAGMSEGAPLALNGDDPYLRGAQLPAHVRPVWFALDDASADVRAEEITALEDGSTRFTLVDAQHGRFMVTVPILGRHNVYDALSAYAVATRLGLDPARAAAALSNFRQTGMRQRVVRCRELDVIEDCYNANPDSMRAALEMFRDYPCKKRIVLMGDMLELGSVRESAHREAGRQAAACGVQLLVTYGEAAKLAAAEAAALGVEVICADSHEEAGKVLLQAIEPGCALLAKGSRGMQLEKALQYVYAVQGVLAE